jgi:hypothetical protein
MFTTAPLFGKFHSRLKKTAAPLRNQPLHHLENTCKGRFDLALLDPNPEGVNSRECVFTPKISFLGFLDQTLTPGTSCRRTADQIRSSYQALSDCPSIDAQDSAYCQARKRWDLAKLIKIRRDLTNHIHLSDNCLEGVLVTAGGILTPKVVDGTSLNAPDTKKNRQQYPQSESQTPQCGFPLISLVGIFSLRTGALLERAYGPDLTSENALFHQLWPTLEKGDLILGDRLFGAYCDIFGLKDRGVQSVFHHHASRNADFRQGVRLGRWDRLITWSKPRSKPKTISDELWAKVPPTLTLRMVRFRVPTQNGRCKKITLITTLLDPLLWPLKVLADLYARRWKIELYWDDIKTTLQMDMLSCKSPEMIHKEMEMHFIAYNLIRSLMAEAAETCNVPLDRMSFKGTLDALQTYSQRMETIPASCRKRRRVLHGEMLAAIAKDALPYRPDRREWRGQKRRPKAYPFMTRPRHQMKDRPKSGYCRR